jgi:uncharacterized protein YacL (UPF0231 family)
MNGDWFADKVDSNLAKIDELEAVGGGSRSKKYYPWIGRCETEQR